MQHFQVNFRIANCVSDNERNTRYFGSMDHILGGLVVGMDVDQTDAGARTARLSPALRNSGLHWFVSDVQRQAPVRVARVASDTEEHVPSGIGGFADYSWHCISNLGQVLPRPELEQRSQHQDRTPTNPHRPV